MRVEVKRPGVRFGLIPAVFWPVALSLRLPALPRDLRQIETNTVV